MKNQSFNLYISQQYHLCCWDYCIQNFYFRVDTYLQLKLQISMTNFLKKVAEDTSFLPEFVLK